LHNFYTLSEIIEKGFDSLALRYLFLQTHYRQEMNFTFEALEAAQNALNRLRREISVYGQSSNSIKEYEEQFSEAINDDLNMPKALSVAWEVVRSDKPDSEKAATVFKFDEVLGLSLKDSKSIVQKEEAVPGEVQKMLDERETLRKEKKFAEADKIRERIIEMGYKVEDKS
jgi:cysteinyl-tRNA synthetase